jgi:hypothetical protein
MFDIKIHSLSLEAKGNDLTYTRIGLHNNVNPQYIVYTIISLHLIIKH